MASSLVSLHPHFPVQGELQVAVERLLDTSPVTPQFIWLEGLAQVARSLQLEQRAVAPFLDAWRAFYTAALHLDHLQDGDPLHDRWLAERSPALQYHLTFSLYVFAQHALASLHSQGIAANRLARLQSFWALSVARIADGQYADLMATLLPHDRTARSALDQYEQIAARKTGAIFGLAFGGIAMLATDDEAQIAALTTVGTIYGLLVQYYDDLVDADAQADQPAAPTLARALLAAHPELAAHGDTTLHRFWASIYASYVRALAPALSPLAEETRAAFAAFVQESFGEPASPWILPTTSDAQSAAERHS